MINNWFFKQIDNSALIVFRVCFGLILTAEAWGAIMTGWVKRIMIDPQFTFHFIGFDFLQPLPGNWMYVYYAIMGLVGVMVMIGYKYRINIIIYTLMWTSVYLMQKSAYNNHYYLQVLLLTFMCFAPAHRYFSIDSKLNPKIRSISMPRWIWIFIVLQVWIVYTYASVAKIYPDWLDGTATEVLMKRRRDYWLIGDFLQQKWVHYVIAYFGLIFDLMVIPMFLWKRTRMVAFILSIFFHIFNSIIFGIGVFPYLSLCFTLFFFPSKTINRIFLKQKLHYDEAEIIVPRIKKAILIFFSLWFFLQISLPLRHWLIKGDVLWTEEGHRLSWRMMLRTKSSRTNIRLVKKSTGEQIDVRTSDYLTRKQHKMLARPDGIWQLCQVLKKEYAKKGEEIEIYVDCKISINGHPYMPLIDPTVDMAKVEWDYFWHKDWILPEPQYGKED